MKNQKGITLIALVITIIVLLILAGVSIAMLTGDNGILTNSQKAKRETQQAEVEDKINLTLNAIKTEMYAQQVNDKTYDGLGYSTTGETKTPTGKVDTAIANVITTDLVKVTDKTGQTGESVYTNEAYTYVLDADSNTLTIYYKSSSNDFKTEGKIVLSSNTASVKITEATSSQISTATDAD